MAQILGEYGLAGYYREGLVELKVDFEVFNNILKKQAKSTYTTLQILNLKISKKIALTSTRCVFLSLHDQPTRSGT